MRKSACRTLGLFARVAGVFVAGSAYAAAQAGPDPAFDVYAKPQQLVTLPDGRAMNLYCLGEGSPTVILAAGGGASTLAWRKVHADLAKTTRVCAYDRAGMGFSAPGPLPRTAEANLADLEALLKAADVRPPYVLVGHSAGSFQVNLYAYRHPDDVVGIVVLDGVKEYQWERVNEATPSEMKNEAAKMQMACVYGVRDGTLKANATLNNICMRMMTQSDPTFSKALNAREKAHTLSPDTWRMVLSEMENQNGFSSAEMMADRRSFGDLPLVHLTAGKMSPSLLPNEQKALLAVNMKLHDEMAANSTQGVNRLVAESGHQIQLEQPQIVIDTVNEVLQQARARMAAKP